MGALYHGGRLEVGALGSADSLFHQLSEKVIEITSFGNKLTIMQDILKFQTDEVVISKFTLNQNIRLPSRKP